MLYFTDLSGVGIFNNTHKLHLDEVFLPLNRIAVTLDKFIFNEGTPIKSTMSFERIFASCYLKDGIALNDIITNNRGFIYQLPNDVILRAYDISNYSSKSDSYFIRSYIDNKTVIVFLYNEIIMSTIIFLADILMTTYIEKHGVDINIDAKNNIYIDKNNINSHIFLCDYITRLFGIIKLLPTDEFDDKCRKDCLILNYCNELPESYCEEVYNSITPNNDGSITVNGQEKIITKHLPELQSASYIPDYI